MNGSKITLFLAFILLTGTITAIIPSSSFITEIHALSDYGLDNNYKKSNDISKSISKNKIKCINDNININGINDGDINVGNKGQGGAARSSFGYGETNTNNGYYDQGYNNKKDKEFDCLINNDNENRQVTSTILPPTPPNPPPPPPPSPCEVTVDTITGLGDTPQGIAYDAINQRMYVTNSFSNTVSVIDTTTNTLIDTDPITPGTNPIPVGFFPIGIAYDPLHERMYVGNIGEETVSVIDTTTFALIDTDPITPGINPIPVGTGPEGIAYDPDNQRMYVANINDDTISVIDTSTFALIDTDPITPGINPITVGGAPYRMAYDPVNQRMYVINYDNDTISVIDTTTFALIDTDPITPGTNPIPVGEAPGDIAYDPINQRMYVLNRISETVSVIDTTTNRVIDTIPSIGNFPYSIAYDPINQDMYVTVVNDGIVSVIDTTTNRVIDTIPSVGNSSYGIAYDPSNHRMYVVLGSDEAVSVINLCPRPAQLQQQQSTNDIIMTTANNINDYTFNNNIIEQTEDQKLAEEQKIQKSIVMSPPSLP